MTSKRAKIIMEEESWISDLSLELSSAKTVFGIEDLLTKILLCVPPKSLIRLKYVSRDWCRTISNRGFVYNHYARHHNLTTMLLLRVSTMERPLKAISLCGQAELVTLPFLHECEMFCRTDLLHSCNGLMLSLSISNDSVGRLYYKYFVCNLTTQEYELLRDVPNIGYKSHGFLEFDPEISPYYKVLLIGEKVDKYMCSIYSSENKSWKRFFITEAPSCCPNTAYLDGEIHWMNDRNFYFRFVIAEERVFKTRMPLKPKFLNSDILYLGNYGGQLLLIMRLPYGFEVLMKEKETCCWTLKDRVNLETIMHVQTTKGLNKCFKLYVLGFVKEIHESGYALLMASPSQLMSYNMRQHNTIVLRDFSSDEFRKLENMASNVCSQRCYLPFIESLLPVSFDK